MRQQLEYVAVSRASKTATIISNDVRVEDTPMNHINGTNVTGTSNIDNNNEITTINNKQQRYSSTINITQNASGRLGFLDAEDEKAFRQAKEILRNPSSTKEQLANAEKTLNELYSKKKAEMESIFSKET